MMAFSNSFARNRFRLWKADPSSEARAFGRRPAIALGAAMALLLAGLVFAWHFPTSTPAGSAASVREVPNERARLLLFFKAAYERLEQQLNATPSGPATASLLQEQAAVLHKIRDLAGAVPDHELPSEIRRLLMQARPAGARAPAPGASDTPEQAQARPAGIPAPTPGASAIPEQGPAPAPSERRSPVLAVGLQPASPLFDIDLNRDPALSRPSEAGPLRPPNRPKTPKNRSERRPESDELVTMPKPSITIPLH